MMDYEPAVLEFCEKTKLDPIDAMGRFMEAWDAVRCPEGEDAWGTAVRLAELGPKSLSPNPGVTYAKLARVCYHLSAMSGGEPFPVPVSRVAAMYGKTTQTASKAIRALVRLKVLAVADGDYKFTEGKAKTYRFLAIPNQDIKV